MSTKRYVRLVSPRCVNGKNEKNGKRSYSTTAPYTFSSNFRFSPVTEEYRSGNSRDGSIEDDDAYMGDEYESKDGYEDSSSNSDFQPKVRYTFTFHIFLSSSQGNGIDSASRFFPSFAKLNVQWSIVVVSIHSIQFVYRASMSFFQEWSNLEVFIIFAENHSS